MIILSNSNDSSTNAPAAPVKTPVSLFVLIILILGATYYYAAFVDTSSSNGPEATVNSFYRAYFEHDYDTVSSETSVFWAIQYLPQYQNLDPAQVMAERSEIIQDFAEVLYSLGASQPVQGDISIQILPHYTRILSHSALIAYDFIQDGNPAGMEAALLIKEDGGFKIYSVNPTSEEVMLSVTDDDMELINNNCKALLGIE